MNMKVILKEKVANLGNIGDRVMVKPGYARNFLFPFRKAVPATLENIAEFERHRIELEKAAAELLAKAEIRAKKLEGKTFKIIANSSEEGRLFGSVGLHEIAKAIMETGMEVEKREIDLGQGPIRQIGKYEIVLRLHTDVSVTLKIEVEPKKN